MKQKPDHFPLRWGASSPEVLTTAPESSHAEVPCRAERECHSDSINLVGNSTTFKGGEGSVCQCH